MVCNSKIVDINFDGLKNITYNFKTKKSIAKGIITKEGEGY